MRSNATPPRSSRVEQTRWLGSTGVEQLHANLLVGYHPISAYQDDKTTYEYKMLCMHLSGTRLDIINLLLVYISSHILNTSFIITRVTVTANNESMTSNVSYLLSVKL